MSAGSTALTLHRAGAPDAAFLDADADALHTLLPGPTLFEIPGGPRAPLFVSVLLHGNETTGLAAAQRVLRPRAGRLPRPLLLFVGNVAAARACVRTLPDQHDYNRAWPGTDRPDSPEARVMAEVVAAVRARAPFASLDIHNNTGLNPHYGCVNRLDERYFHLARLFSRVVVYFTRPLGVQSLALAPICPAVTVECGKVGDASGIEHAAGFLEAALHLNDWPAHPVPAHDLELLHTTWRVTIAEDVTFSFDGTPADLVFRGDLDHLNFRPLAAGASLGRVSPAGARALVVEDAEGRLAPDFFDCTDGELRLTRDCVPSMLTRDPNAVRLDCLCYLMQRIDRDGTPLA